MKVTLKESGECLFEPDSHIEGDVIRFLARAFAQTYSMPRVAGEASQEPLASASPTMGDLGSEQAESRFGQGAA